MGATAIQPTLDIDAGPKPCKSPVSWVGGKHYSAKHIIAEMPEHHHYVEVFGGGAHVLCQKPPSPIETYNDTNEDVVNFFGVVRETADALQARLSLMPYSRALWYQLRDAHCNGGLRCDDRVKWAADWFALLRQSFSAKIAGGLTWRYMRTSSRRGMAKTNSEWLSAIALLDTLATRFFRAQIECLDFRDLIAKYDTPSTLFYADPPYVGTEDYYCGDFDEQAHRDLAALLRRAAGKAMISYYDCPLVAELYSDWRRVSWQTSKRAENVNGGTRQRATELLLMNFDENGNKLEL